MKAKSCAVALTVLVVIFGSVSITSYLGQWKTTTEKVPAKYTEGESAGEYNPADSFKPSVFLLMDFFDFKFDPRIDPWE